MKVFADLYSPRSAEDSHLRLRFLLPDGIPNGAVQFLALESDGKVLIGGWFTTFDGTNCSSLARLNANGTLDTSFNPDFGVRHYWNCGDVCYAVSFPTAATVQPDGKVLVGFWRESWQCDALEGGCFTSYSYSMTRLNADGTSDPGFAFTNHLNNIAPLGLVDSIAVQSDGRIVVGSGAYNTVHIARVNANGTWDNFVQFRHRTGRSRCRRFATGW